LGAYQQQRLNDANAQYQAAITNNMNEQAKLDWYYQQFMDSTYNNRNNQQYVQSFLNPANSLFSGSNTQQAKQGIFNVGGWF
jgi:hypothetical protein